MKLQAVIDSKVVAQAKLDGTLGTILRIEAYLLADRAFAMAKEHGIDPGPQCGGACLDPNCSGESNITQTAFGAPYPSDGRLVATATVHGGER